MLCLLQDEGATESATSALSDAETVLSSACSAATSTEVMASMEVGQPLTTDVDMTAVAFPPLPPSNNKRTCPPSPVKDAPGDKTPRIEQDPQLHPDQYVKVSFLLRAVSGARIFNNPGKVTHALHQSNLAKYIMGEETRSLGNGSALIIAVWDHLLPKVPQLSSSTFDLGEWPVYCRRAERECGDFQYARVGPLGDDVALSEVMDKFRAFDGERVEELAWIPAHHLPRATTGRWVRLKVRGTPPTKVAISQVIYRPLPYLLPLLRCPGCQKIGHSINTCRSAIRCSRCSGPHSYKQAQDTTCTRPYHCFQCGGAHGPRSPYCPLNRQAQQVYAAMAQDGKPLHVINKELRTIALQNPHAPHRTHHTPPASSARAPNHTPPAPAASTRPHPPPVRQVQSGVSFSAITTGNRFSALQDPHDDDTALDDATVAVGPSPTTRSTRYRRQPRSHSPASSPPPPPPTPSLPADGFTHQTVVADVLQPHSPSHHHDSGRSSRPGGSPSPMPPRQPGRPAAPYCSTPSPTLPLRTEGVLSDIFILLWDAYRLYQTGTSVPVILTTLWPTLSKLLTTFLQ